MSNVSIFEKKWIDLVFEGKNKEYGAYQLRKENSKTTIFALFFGIAFLFGLVFILSSFSNSTPIITKCPETGTKIIISGGHYPPEKKVKKIESEAKKTEIKNDLKKDDLKNLVVAKKEEKFSDVKTIDESKSNSTTSETGTKEGTGLTTTTNGTGTNTGETGSSFVTKKESPENLALLDKQPEFPGGIKKFYEYVGTNFDKPSIEDIESISVIVSFVIEKDGSMTDIKVLRNPGYGLDKEAIRVLKALKIKWKPGIKEGQFVRTQYTLPIRIQMN